MIRCLVDFCPLVFIIALFIPVFALAQQEPDPERLETAAAAKKMIEENDSYGAIEMIQGKGDFNEIAQRYEFLVRDLYWQEKAIHAIVPIARAGIQYCLTKADELAEKDAAAAEKMVDYAKIISYNLSSFTWPGWDEKDIVITEEALVAGLEAAMLNVRLVERLGANPAQLSNSYWAIGAQYLAMKEYSKAKKAFESAVTYAQQAGGKGAELMNNGYIAMSGILAGTDKEKAQADFDKTVKALQDIGTDDSKFFANQLVSVLKFFSK
jgi:tetratricopeptide (TPR) repeat protein